MEAKATSEITRWDETAIDEGPGAALSRATVGKAFSGELSGTGEAHLLLARGQREGSAAYSGVERFTGVLAGRSGTFVVQHAAVSAAGEDPGVAPVRVVPDSGTGDLAGIGGTAEITVAPDGTHTIVLRYELE